MPLGHRSLSAWYHQLAQLLEAGVPIADAVLSVRRSGLPGRVTEHFAAALQREGAGTSAWETLERWLPRSDRRLLAAAAETGRVPTMLRRLAQRHADVAHAQLRLVLACLYPVGILHVGLLLFPLGGMLDWEKGFQWNATAYVRSLAATLLPLWLAIGFGAWLAKRQSRGFSVAIESVPLFRGYSKNQALADFAFALGNFVEAGVRIDRAWGLAGDVAPQRDLQRAAAAVQAVIARGERPGRALADSSRFPNDFIAMYQSGENSGQLDQSLFHAAAAAQSRANRALSLAMLVYPGVVFLLVAAGVIFHVIRFYAGYFRMIEKLGS